MPKVERTKRTRGRGNTRTRPPRKKEPPRTRKWCFTINNPTDDDNKQVDALISPHKYCVGQEIGENGTPHIQGYVHLTNPKAFSAMRTLLPRAHLEPARGTDRQNYEYCRKGGNYRSNMFPMDRMTQTLIRQYDGVIWRDWQQEILDLKASTRTIHWRWEGKGNVGKTYLCKYLALTRKGVIICEGKKADIFNQVCCMMQPKHGEGECPQLIIVDIPRTSFKFINYAAIEALKNGLLYSGKYEGGRCIFPEPIVICFANEPPDTSALSADRWDIKEIGADLSLDENDPANEYKEYRPSH